MSPGACENCGQPHADVKHRRFCSLICLLRAHEARLKYVHTPSWLWSASVAARKHRKRLGLEP